MDMMDVKRTKNIEQEIAQLNRTCRFLSVVNFQNGRLERPVDLLFHPGNPVHPIHILRA